MIDSQIKGRLPTPKETLYAWHTLALTGKRVPVYENEPQCGYFLRYFGAKNDKTAKPPEPASIYMEAAIDEGGHLTGPEVLKCEVGGRAENPQELWTWLAKNPISRAEYLERVAQIGEF